MIKKYKLQTGVTIVELLVYMALMSILLLVLLDVFTTTINTKLSSESTASLSQDSRYILSKLSYDINNADSVISPALGVTGSSLQLLKDGSTYNYASGSGNFVETVGGVGMSLNSLDTGLESISFKNVGDVGGKPTIQLSFTLKSKITVYGGTATQSIKTTIGTR